MPSVAQLGEHTVAGREVAGSNPVRWPGTKNHSEEVGMPPQVGFFCGSLLIAGVGIVLVVFIVGLYIHANNG